MILYSRLQPPPSIIHVPKCYINHLHHKVGNYPPVRYQHHDGVLTSVNLHIGCLVIDVVIEIYLGVGSSSYHSHISA